MLSGEIRKWFCNKNIIVILVAILLLQTAYFISGFLFGTDEVCGYQGYRKYTAQITDQNKEKIQNQLEKIMNPENLYQEDGIQAEYTASAAEEEILYRTVLSELKQVESYPSYLEELMNSENTILSAFAQSDYAKKDNHVIARVYSGLDKNSVEYGRNYACHLFSKMGLEDILCIALFLFTTVSVVTIEREKFTVLIVRGMPKGQGKISLVKYLWGLAVSLFLVALFYGVKLVLLSATYGLGNLSVPMQGILDMKGAYLPISVGEYLLLFMLLKFLACAMIYSILFCVAAFFSTSVQVYGVSAGIIAVEYVLYALIEKTGSLVFLCNYNLFSFWNVGDLLGSYHNTNVFGDPVPYPLLWILILGTGIVFFMWFGIRGHSGFRLLERNRTGRKRKEKDGERMVLPGVLFRGEAVKCWICGRGIYLLILSIMAVGLFSVSVKEDLNDEGKAYYKQYIKEVEGKYSEKKMQHLLAEQNRLEEVQEKISQPGITQDAAQIFKKDLDHLLGLKPAISYGEYLGERKGVYFVYPSGYLQMLNGEEGKWNRIMRNLIAAFLMAGVSVSVWGIEKWSGMGQIIQISKKGWHKIFFRKAGMIMLNGIIVLIAVYTPGIVCLFREYGCAGILAPAQSIQEYKMIPNRFNILFILCLFYVLHLIIIWGIGFISGFVQRKLNSQIISTIVSMLISGVAVLILSV